MPRISRWLAAVLLLVFSLSPGLAEDDLESSVARMAKIGFSTSPSFSPDGKRVAFISNISGLPQIWTVAVENGWPALVTSLEHPVSAIRWSPEGSWLAFLLAPGGGMNQQVALIRPDGTRLRRLTPGGKETNRLDTWSHDGRLLALSSNRRRPSALDAYLYDVRRESMRLAATNPGVGAFTDIGRDNRFAVLSRLENRGDNNLFLIDLKTGRETLLTPHEPPGSFGAGTFSADGRTIYLSSNKDHDLTAFAAIRLDDAGRPGPIEVLAGRSDAELQSFELTEDAATAALLWNVAGKSELAFMDLGTGKITAGPELPGEIADGLDFSKAGTGLTETPESISRPGSVPPLLAMTITGATAPSDIWLLDRRTSAFSQLTHSPHAGVNLDSLVAPGLVRFRAHDRIELSGWLYRARGVSGAGPVVLSFHGGPEGQERPAFRSDYQALLARGISVFAPNVRGSSGFGKRFVNLDNGPLRVNGIRDIKTCVEYVVKARVGDPARIGIMGGSYGGYMVMAALTEYPDLFAAGADLYGIVNFATFFKHTEPWMSAISKIEYGDPVTQQALLRELSPIHKIDRVKAPTIVLHGANDTNVPVVEAEQVVKNLKSRGVPVEYILFEDEGHGFRKTANRVKSTVAIVRWFEKYLKAP